MNTTNPLMPQGSFLEKPKNKGKSNLVFAAVTILAIHLVLFGGLLMQGCKREAPSPTAANPAQPTNNNPLPPLNTSEFPNTYPTATATNTNLPAPPPPSTLSTSVPPVSTSLPPIHPIPEAPTTETPTSGGGKQYTVVKGDSFYKIAKEHGVSVRAIEKANPEINPQRLRPGEKITLPAPSVTTAPAAGAGNGAGRYVVKSGDTLSKIAREHGTTVKALKAANHLRTDRILVGQKLVLPKSASKSTTNGNESATNPLANP